MPSEITLLAKTDYRGEYKKFGIKTDDRRRHMYLVGKTGMGKSCMIENMVIQDIQNGHGIALVDPHGDLVEKVLNFIPPERINDVIYFNPADYEHPIAFNVLENVDPEKRHLIASGLLGIFKKIWADSWGPRLEYVLNNTIMALLEYPDSTLLGIMRMLVDKDYRSKVVRNLTDPVVRSFWIDEYDKYPQKFQAEVIAPIQNKVGRFLSTPLTRNIVGQVKSSLSLRDIVDNKKILLMNLSKGRIGEDNSALLGAMIITKIQLAIMSRVDMPEDTRADFYLYVDEFQNFATESFTNILSEARKYRLNLIVAHQYIEQLEESVAAAIFGNVGTIITFRIGAADAEFLEKEFAPHITPEDLVNLAKYKIYTKLMIDGVASSPFQALTLEPTPIPENGDETTQKVIRVSRERYTASRESVERKILKWSGVVEDEIISQEKNSQLSGKDYNFDSTQRTKEINKNNKTKIKDKEGLHKTKCDECSKEISVPFEPDGVRPVYCNDCFSKIKKNKELEKNSKKLTLEDAFKISQKNNQNSEDDDEDYEPLHKER
jgi:CxxC-x17-CxxC domain-containing protein